MLKITGIWVLLLLLLLQAGCATSRSAAVADMGKSLPAPDTTSASGAYEGGSEYRLGAQDLLQISVFGVPDLDREIRVNSNGQISLPLIGAVAAGGKTIPELEQEIARKLSESYLQNPQVTVFVKEYTSQRVTLQGALRSPGIYPLTGKTSLLQAVAMAGGFDQLAEANAVVVFRQVEGKKMAAVFDMTKISTGAAEDPLIYGDDIIVVSQSGSRNALQELIKTAPVLALFFLL